MTLDTNLAGVRAATLLEHLRQALTARARQTLEPEGRSRAAVLLLVYPRGRDYTVVFTKRTSLVESHKGEVCFPGGGFDAGVDASLRHTALRETAEEIGLTPDAVEVLGQLDDLQLRSGYHVSPYVATLSADYVARGTMPAWQPQAAEVAEILEVPLGGLVLPDALRSEPRTYADRLIRGSYYLHQDHVIWGATARILHQFLELVPPSLVM